MYTQAVKVEALTACCILMGCILIFPMRFEDKVLRIKVLRINTCKPEQMFV